MDRAEVITRLRAVEPELKPLGMSALYRFGSYARDEAGPDSDVDVFVDKAPGEKFGFHEFMAAHEVLQAGTARNRSPIRDAEWPRRNTFGPDVEREAIRISVMAATKNPLVQPLPYTR